MPLGPEQHKNALQLQFMRTMAKDVLERRSRQEWLRLQRSPMLIGQDPSTGFCEYRSGDNLAKLHACFVDDRMVLLEQMVIRDQGGVERAMREFGNALGPPDSTLAPERLAHMRPSGFKHWRVSVEARDLVVECWTTGGESAGGGSVPYFGWAVVDMGAAARAAGIE